MENVCRVPASEDIKSTVLNAVEGVGGFRAFVRTGDVVYVKPNFNTADPAPASTEIGFLKAVVELAYDHGAKSVVIPESSTITLNTRKVLEKAGVYDLHNLNQPPRVYNLDEGVWIRRDIPNAKYLKSVQVPDIMGREDALIYLPNLKTHHQARYTGALKLSVAFMRPSERVWLHLKNIEEKIAELNTLFHPSLVIMDARKCFIQGGPAKGVVAEPNCVLASRGRVAIDIEGIKLIQQFHGNALEGIVPEEFPQIRRAMELGIL